MKIGFGIHRLILVLGAILWLIVFLACSALALMSIGKLIKIYRNFMCKFQFGTLSKSTQPVAKLPCHCEERSDVAISSKIDVLSEM